MNKKKKIIIIILVLLILFGIYMLYNTFAVSTIASNNSDNIYDIDINEDTTINVPKGSSKTIYYHIKNTNKAAVKYGVGYNTSTNIEIKVYEDSKDKVLDIISYGDNKYIKLYLNNPTNSNNTITISCVLGYENGGDLIVPNGITLVTEIYAPPTNLADYITNLYTTTEKSTVVNNEITYNYASSVSLMNDRLGGTTTSLDGGNIRYYGASPNNYIYFNCSDYSNQTSDTCELWRIIGIFDGKVKIMRNESIGEYSWDNKDTDTGAEYVYGKNDWSSARLMKLLNPSAYYTADTNDNGNGQSLYWNAERGTCFSEASNATTSCDFTSSGIKNDVTRNKIAEVTWNTGGWDDSRIYSNQFYEYERGTTVYEGRSTTWTGKVALPYSSDYGYATDFNKCTQNLSNYNSSTDSYACRTNDWMYPILGTNQYGGWLLTPYSGYSFYVWVVAPTGRIIALVSTGDYGAAKAKLVVPTLYLNSNEYIESGNGTEDNPYHLMKDSPIETASKYITNLYTNSNKSTVTNNSITYNYASSESLMNDRLGGTTTSLDEGNIRYYGASPNNYIYFNCSDYSNQTSDTCEIWRIIGVFDDKLKLIRNKQIGVYSWDSSASTVNSGKGESEWSEADLMKLLNPGYDSESVGGSLYYNSSSGKCYSGKSNATTSCDFTSSGIKNDETRDLISSAVYYLGGSNTNAIYTNDIYGYERGNTVYSGRNPTWTGKIALAYPSDYTYAADLNKCTNKTLANYKDSSCTSNDWLYPIISNSGSNYGWLLTTNSDNAYNAWVVDKAGHSRYSTGGVSGTQSITPVLYLKSDIVISGEGSSSNPYKIG